MKKSLIKILGIVFCLSIFSSSNLIKTKAESYSQLQREFVENSLLGFLQQMNAKLSSNEIDGGAAITVKDVLKLQDFYSQLKTVKISKREDILEQFENLVSVLMKKIEEQSTQMLNVQISESDKNALDQSVIPLTESYLKNLRDDEQAKQAKYKKFGTLLKYGFFNPIKFVGLTLWKPVNKGIDAAAITIVKWCCILALVGIIVSQLGYWKHFYVPFRLILRLSKLIPYLLSKKSSVILDDIDNFPKDPKIIVNAAAKITNYLSMFLSSLFPEGKKPDFVEVSIS